MEPCGGLVVLHHRQTDKLNLFAHYFHFSSYIQMFALPSACIASTCSAVPRFVFSAFRIWRVGRGNLPIFYIPIHCRRSMWRVTCVWWNIRFSGCVHCFRSQICECTPDDVVVVGRRRDAHTRNTCRFIHCFLFLSWLSVDPIQHTCAFYLRVYHLFGFKCPQNYSKSH